MAALVDDLAIEMEDPHRHISVHHDTTAAFRNQEEPELESESESEELELEPELESQQYIAPPSEPIFFHEETSLPAPEMPALPELEFLQPLPVDEPTLLLASGPETESVEAPEASAAPATKSEAKGQGRRERHRGDRGGGGGGGGVGRRGAGSEGKASKDETTQDNQRQRRPTKGPPRGELPQTGGNGGLQTGTEKKPAEQQRKQDTRPRPPRPPSQQPKPAATQRDDPVGLAPSRPTHKPTATAGASALPTSRPTQNRGQSSGQGKRDKKELTQSKPIPVA